MRTSRNRPILVAVFSLLAASAVHAQDSVAVRLWQDPRPVAARDLKWGAGAPDLIVGSVFAAEVARHGGEHTGVVVDGEDDRFFQDC